MGACGASNLSSARSRKGLSSMIRAPRRIVQLRHHARVVGPEIRTNADEELGIIELRERHGAFADPDRHRKADGGGFVTHVRAIREIICTELPRKQLEEKCRLVGRTT